MIKNRIKKRASRHYTIRLKTQLTLTFVVIIFIVLSVCILLIYNDVNEVITEKVNEMTITQFEQSEYSINSLMYSVGQISNTLVLFFGMQDFMGMESPVAFNNIGPQLKVQRLNELYDYLWNMADNYDFIHSIYIAHEDGVLIGISPGRNDYNIQRDSGDFGILNELLFNPDKSNEIRLSWNGGYWSADFIMTELTEKISVPYFTASKMVFFGDEYLYTLIINIDERIISSYYAQSPGNETGDMYLTDEMGIIISHEDKGRIGVHSNVVFDLEKSYGNYTVDRADNPRQIIYYQMGTTGWYLIKEIPTHVFTQDILRVRKTIIVIFVLCLIGAVAITWYWMYRVTRPLNNLSLKMGKIEQGQLGIMLDDVPQNELGMLGIQFNRMSKSIEDLMLHNQKIQEEKQRFEIASLRAQINPHFIYNTLNTIKWMAINIKAKNIVESINSLVGILRPVFQNRNLMSTVREELIYVEQFIKIINYRYGEGISLILDIPDKMKDCYLPHFTLQPLVENAVTHGLRDKEYIGRITIEGSYDVNTMMLTVSDNGVGIPEEKLTAIKHHITHYDDVDDYQGIGCANIQHRIQLQYGKDYGLDIKSLINKGTKVTISMPVVHKS